MDQELVSSWPNVQFVPDSYVRPPEERPGKLVLSSCKTNIPVVDLEGHDETQIILHIMKATKDFGFFQVQTHEPIVFSPFISLFFTFIFC